MGTCNDKDRSHEMYRIAVSEVLYLAKHKLAWEPDPDDTDEGNFLSAVAELEDLEEKTQEVFRRLRRAERGVNAHFDQGCSRQKGISG